ncbi:MAG TPA: hypothetical protein VFX98_11345 [Longimicrobiaceae bacterium]|nr:hypothetical protein [Longimicrobiaceae bacterium]
MTEQGLVIPKRMLPDVEEFEIRRENGRVVVIPLLLEEEVGGGDDPILGLGSNPVELGIGDVAENHDRYLYGDDSPEFGLHRR